MNMVQVVKLVIQSDKIAKINKKVPIIAQMWYYYIVNAKHMCSSTIITLCHQLKPKPLIKGFFYTFFDFGNTLVTFMCVKII